MALIDLCNRALSLVHAGAIEALDEASVEAEECKTHAEPLLREIIEWSDRFPWAIDREVLALTTNDRPAEWLYAYVAPATMASPLAVREQYPDAQYLPVSGPGSFPWQDEIVVSFLHEQGRIYTNAKDATLIFVKSQIEVNDLPPLGELAFIYELAHRLAMSPVCKDYKKAETLQRKAEAARARFVADEENKNPRPQISHVSEAEYARMGVGLGWTP
ncbi:MAG: hypothetical protein CL804_03450 [Citromicrobium sp.]|nr:hypothetical protein [Citromicrobium sp.]|tara:strand:- start:1340 stop:1990 length:651 start_codon:yes stop_codon:yes gene_type:complete